MTDFDTVRKFVETAVLPLGPWQWDVLAALDRLVAERDKAMQWESLAISRGDKIHSLTERAEAAEAEAERLREALAWLVERCDSFVGLDGTNAYAAATIEERARAALAASE